MTGKKLYQLEIAPLTLISVRRSPFFSYAFFEPLARGTIVDISFGKQHLKGVVYECRPLLGRLPHWMKMIDRVSGLSPLTGNQCDLALFLSKEYFTPLGNCLKHFLPEKAQAKEKKKAHSEKVRPLPKLLAHESKTLALLLKKGRVPLLFSSRDSASERRILIHFLARKLQDQKSILFLVPEFILALWWEKELAPYFREDLGTLHSKQKGSEISALFEGIRTGKKRLIIGTRQALFTPYGQLDTILMNDEEDQTSYKQWEMSPRYVVRDVSRELARLHKARLIFVSRTPSLQSLFEKGKKRLTLLREEKKGLSSQMGLINMRFEKKREKSVLSQTLQDEISTALQQKQKILLIGKQGGISPLSTCAHCRTVLRCPKCEHVLISERGGHFSCHHCGYATGVFPTCRECGHMTFKSFGAGTEKIERDMHLRFPGARILRLDRRTLEKRAAMEDAIETVRNEQYDVLIGTYAATKIPSLPSLGLVAIIEADSHLSFPDYQAEEKLVRDVERSRLLVVQGRAGKVLLQTFEPESPLFREDLHVPYLDEAKLLLENRKTLGYPPEIRFLKAECPAKTLEESQKKALKLAKEVSLLIQKEKLSVTLIPPHLPLALSRQRHYQFFLRFPGDTPLPPALRSWCEKVSSECYFDLDPLNLT